MQIKVHVTCILKINFYGWKVKSQYISHFNKKKSCLYFDKNYKCVTLKVHYKYMYTTLKRLQDSWPVNNIFNLIQPSHICEH